MSDILTDKISITMSFTSIDGNLNFNFVIVSYKKIYLQLKSNINAANMHIVNPNRIVRYKNT